MHIISASQASSPSTVARAENFHSSRFCFSNFTSKISWSPGTTGRLKRALSMPTKYRILPD